MLSSDPSPITLNGAYHYPPDLLELLTDAIPALFKSKQAVIDFFQGAGTPPALLTGWRHKLRTERQSVKKHEITRDVLRSLNEAGDATLSARREVIKRVSEFEDFSTCWDNDRLKAQALVSQVRHVVNIKDSFTRMKIEREKESDERKRNYREATEKLQKQIAERQQIRTDLYALFGRTDAHKRGKALESVLNRLFASFGILIRDAFAVKGNDGEGIIEQIDGVVEIKGDVYLVEMKWWDKPIGREHIAPHLVSVFNRGGDVRGIFISYSGFSAPAITEVKTALAHKIFVLMELQEITQALDRDVDLEDLLLKKAHRAQTHKNPLYKPAE